MINGYLTVSELASKWGVSPRRIQVLCASGEIEGAVKFGKSWAIPEKIERPNDGRITTGAYMNWRKKLKDTEE